MKQLLPTLFLSLCLLFSMSEPLYAQGVTTATIAGSVTDQAGEELPGANIVAVHQPSGTRYATVTRVDGRYNLPNVRTGGPYMITASFVGYITQEVQVGNLALGQTYNANFTLAEENVELAEVTVYGVEDRTFNSGRTGAATNVSREQLESLPTLSRSLGDFTRLTPQANGNSFGGMNNRFNNITIDGAVNNDVFGLSSSGTPGGQAGTEPISLDAIQEIQVVLAPYDVSLGNFTGGGVNAITRSGTNSFEGSVYGFGRNQNTIGNDPETGEKAEEFTNYQYGARLGGPIVRNKLFFFANVDFSRRAQPLAFNAGDAGALITRQQAEELSSFLIENYNYDPGSYSPITARTESNKWFGRLDWNIAPGHQLTLRHNYVEASDDNISRSNTNFRFGNNAYVFNSSTHASVMELKSRFSNRFANNLILGYSRIRESRDTEGRLFPQVEIREGQGTISLGAQRSSTANELDQDIFEITDNFKIYSGRHTVTLGTHNEFFSFRNLFINNFAGRWNFNSLEDFYNNNPARAQATYSLLDDPRPAAEFNAMQLSFYAQDEIAFSRLTLTAGLRVDIPVFPDAPLRNPEFEQTFPGYRTDQVPSGQLLWAPRLGFNWDATGDRSVQVRGGTGIFTGRVPFVWLSNQFTNTGVMFGSVFVDARRDEINQGQGFEPDPSQQRNVGPPGTTVEVNAISDDFKIPQVFRTNLAVDFALPGEIVATLEGIYTKTLNNILYQNLNLEEPVGRLEPELSGGEDRRQLYPRENQVNENFTHAILLTNTSRGYSYNLTGQLRKNFDNGIMSSIAYTYGMARDVNSGTSSTARSNWEFNQIVNDPNNPELGFSAFDLRHRIVGSLGYRLEWANNFATSFSLFYAGRSGNPFTYLYFGDLNQDGNRSNDLMYVPRDASEIELLPITDRDGNVTLSPEEQWTALNSFIEQDDYLSSRRGQFTERNAARTPWEHQFDLRLMQDIFVNIGQKQHTLQLTLDVFNVGNLLNSAWGRQYFVSFGSFELLSFDDRNREGFSYRPVEGDPWAVAPFASRWQGQLGLRYIFN